MNTAIKAVHACRRQVKGLEEEDIWRTYLQNLTGKRSLREMSERELGVVIDELRRDGAKSKGNLSSKAHVRKVYAIWSDMCRQSIPDNPTKEALHAFVHHMTAVDHPNWLTIEQAQKVIEGLKGWMRRELRKRDQQKVEAEEKAGNGI